jgi:hypothetical protein
MKLYHVQDGDRPMWVVADSYAMAVERWKEKVSDENPLDCPTKLDVGDPDGVTLVCDEDEVLL